jgi:hypothetical protein
MSNDKDRFGDKIHDVEKAREDQWARQHDEELLQKMRQHQAGEVHCPQCNGKLTPRTIGKIAVHACPNHHGAWLDADALRHLEQA